MATQHVLPVRIVFLFVAVISGILLACSEENGKESEPVTEVLAERVGDNQVLFSYVTANDLNRELTAAGNTLVTEMQTDITQVRDCVYMNAIVKVGNGKGCLTEFSFLDANKNIISRYVWDETSRAFPLGMSVLPLVAGCPDGFTGMAICSYASFSSCWSGAVGNYVVNNFDQAGCAEFSFTVGMAAVTVCRKRC